MFEAAFMGHRHQQRQEKRRKREVSWEANVGWWQPSEHTFRVVSFIIKMQ